MRGIDVLFLIVIFTMAIVYPIRLVIYAYVIIPQTSAFSSNPAYHLITFDIGTKPSVDGEQNVKSRRLDDYADPIKVCDDFYSKVGSLFDVKSKLMSSPAQEDNEEKDTTGTFKNMIDANNELMDQLLHHGYGPSLKLCQEYMSSTSPKDMLTFVKEQNITSLFDVWLYGGASLFKITTRVKVLHESYYAVDIDIDFKTYFRLLDLASNETQPFLENALQYYSLIDMSTYPVSMEDSIQNYKQVANLSLTLATFLQGMGMAPEDWITLNGQEPFFEQIFTSSASNSDDLLFLVFLMQLAKEYHFQSTLGGLSKPPSNHAAIMSMLDLRRHTTFGQEDLWNWKWTQRHQTLNEIPDEVQTYCKKKVRDIFFTSINNRYSALVDGPANAPEIVSLVQQIRDTSILFFANRTGDDFSMYWSKNYSKSTEFLLHSSKDMALFAIRKMQNLTICAMASTEDTVRISEEQSENQFFVEWKTLYAPSYIHLYHLAKKRQNKITILNDMRYLRSDSYIAMRSNISFNLLHLWRTVKAETVNAWYNPTQNSISIPIGITRFPMFRRDLEYDIPFLGSVIGHEIGHATDNSGKEFDEFGNYIGVSDPNTEGSSTEKCLAQDYGMACGNAEYGMHTLGEDMADQFGLRMVLFLVHYNLLYHINVSDYAATRRNDYRNLIAAQYTSDAQNELALNRQTLLEDMFVNFARIWCGRSTYNQECKNAHNDVHALARHRVVKTLRQFGSFKSTFQCNTSDFMVNEKPCIVY